MESTNRADSFADIRDAADCVEVIKPGALIQVAGDEDDLINDL